MLYFQDGQRVMLWNVEDKGKWSQVKMSSNRLDKQTDKRKYSDWSFVRFVGQAHTKVQELDFNPEKGLLIELKGAGQSKEEYQDKDGKRAWPKNPQIVVFNFEVYSRENEEIIEPDLPSEEDEIPDFMKD